MSTLCYEHQTSQSVEADTTEEQCLASNFKQKMYF